MIIICIGALGSGKTLSMVRELMLNDTNIINYSNIKLKNCKNFIQVKPSDVIKKGVDDKGKPKLELNIEFWQNQKKPLNIIWDEIHLSGGNARKSMSGANMVLSRFIAMGRRIVGMNEYGIYGHFVFIAQNMDTIEKNIRDLASEIRYHVGRWVLRCQDCGHNQAWNSDKYVLERCLNCDSSKVRKTDLEIEVLKFQSWDNLYDYLLNKKKSYFQRILISDIEKYFVNYDTLSIEGFWEDYIN